MAGRSTALADARAKAATAFASGGRGGGGGGAGGGHSAMKDDDATEAKEARRMAAMFHALDPEQKGWVSSIELLFLLVGLPCHSLVSDCYVDHTSTGCHILTVF
jgi:hypothetical protein